MGSCGYECLRYLLVEYSENANEWNFDRCHVEGALRHLELNYGNQEELSFADMYDVLSQFGIRAQAFEISRREHSEKLFQVPCIAKLQLGNWHHFVVVTQFGWFVRYVEPGKGRRVLPQFLFNMAFSRYIFVVDCF